eukprot:TRINITY_DN15023_c0_g1::TRINITY_DN15023_c0_g1_i1::g.25829::m.25829 TRINITY_DN15023_c0_g1::TRINITY_DN15023_c0_g1_i1::g.25829  ORF type:complete len:411 (-),score=81.19,sp/O14214/TRM10_SCHPO/35.16/3e-46,tRNA_m1G_MT/PF01746.16/3.5e+03,tRNA_m1G_MT/PF01746.16/4.2e-35,Plectin/PF00681.15/0.22,NMDAR2_C/PF10565.4/0.17 TRINITY_DN15023_c0_g1_i1:546-1778(-)
MGKLCPLRVYPGTLIYPDQNHSDHMIRGEMSETSDALTVEAASKQPEENETEKPLSKNQLRKQKKFEVMLQKKEEKKRKRKEESEDIKLKKRARLESLPAEERAVAVAEAKQRRSDIIKAKREAKRREIPADALKVVVDLDFESLMHENEIKSLSQQVMYCYGKNQKAVHPLSLYFTGVGPNVQRHFDRLHAEHWYGVHISKDSYETVFKKEELVYLTADSEHTITELDRSKTYIIGGIVDHNRHKNVTWNKAAAQGLATARLPLESFFKVHKKVITVNQVVELIHAWEDTRDWKLSIERVLPTRGGNVLPKPPPKDKVSASSATGTSQDPGQTTVAELDDRDQERESNDAVVCTTGEGDNDVCEGQEEGLQLGSEDGGDDGGSVGEAGEEAAERDASGEGNGSEQDGTQ